MNRRRNGGKKSVVRRRNTQKGGSRYKNKTTKKYGGTLNETSTQGKEIHQRSVDSSQSQFLMAKDLINRLTDNPKGIDGQRG